MGSGQLKIAHISFIVIARLHFKKNDNVMNASGHRKHRVCRKPCGLLKHTEHNFPRHFIWQIKTKNFFNDLIYAVTLSTTTNFACFQSYEPQHSTAMTWTSAKWLIFLFAARVAPIGQILDFNNNVKLWCLTGKNVTAKWKVLNFILCVSSSLI